MKLTYNKIFFSSFIVVWFAAIVINAVLPFRSYSENENRYLTAFPKFTLDTMIDGKFMTGVDDFLNDKFIARDTWISAQSVLEYTLGKRESNNVFIGKGALIKKVDGPNRSYVEKNIVGINEFTEQTKLPTRVMVVPSASEIQADKLPPFAVTWDQKTVIDDAYAGLTDAKGIELYDTLTEHRSEYIYYRTDHHWTSYGAYLAYVAYCVESGLTPADYAADTVSTSFNGTLYSSSGVRFIPSDTIEAFKVGADASCDVFDGKETTHYDSVYFSDYLTKKDKYAYFLGTNQPIVTIYGDNPSGQNLLVFKDSYSHCMAPMLLANYSKVTLVDPRYINKGLDTYLDLSEYDEALFLFSIDSFANQNNIYKLALLMREE